MGTTTCISSLSTTAARVPPGTAEARLGRTGLRDALLRTRRMTPTRAGDARDATTAGMSRAGGHATASGMPPTTWTRAT